MLHKSHVALRQRQKRLQNARYPKITERAADEHQHFPTSNVFARQWYLGEVHTDHQKTQKAQQLECLKRRNIIYFKGHFQKKEVAKIDKFFY